MFLVTDSLAYTARLLPDATAWSEDVRYPSAALVALGERVFGDRPVFQSEQRGSGPWSCLFVRETAPDSQFDLLVELGRQGTALPDGTLCVAGSGTGLHGMRGRRWTALPGNIHLSVRLLVPPDLARSAAPFVAMAAVSVVETIDRIPGLEDRAGIRWVNDVFVDGAKVSGILAHVDTDGPDIASAVIGIGLNVETRPLVEPSVFVPQTDSLAAAGGSVAVCHLGPVFALLLDALATNWRRLLEGRYREIVARYRDRSLVLGRHVTVFAEGDEEDRPLERVSGRVERLGDDLELYLEGVAAPLATGRVVLREP
jgi:BirA family biotin operon repressor/biotin-[acetyl-CoA-carboxylase] ligase